MNVVVCNVSLFQFVAVGGGGIVAAVEELRVVFSKP